MAEVGKKTGAKKTSTKKTTHKRGDQPDVAGHDHKKHTGSKRTGAKRADQPDVQGHIVARDHRKGDDPSIHAR